MLLAAAGCVQSPPLYVDKAPCSALIPQAWKAPVPHAAKPDAPAGDADALLKGWIAFALAEAGQLEKANGRAADTVAIIEACETRDKAAVKKSRAKWLGVF